MERKRVLHVSVENTLWWNCDRRVASAAGRNADQVFHEDQKSGADAPLDGFGITDYCWLTITRTFSVAACIFSMRSVGKLMVIT